MIVGVVYQCWSSEAVRTNLRCTSSEPVARQTSYNFYISMSRDFFPLPMQLLSTQAVYSSDLRKKTEVSQIYIRSYDSLSASADKILVVAVPDTPATTE